MPVVCMCSGYHRERFVCFAHFVMRVLHLDGAHAAHNHNCFRSQKYTVKCRCGCALDYNVVKPIVAQSLFRNFH